MRMIASLILAIAAPFSAAHHAAPAPCSASAIMLTIHGTHGRHDAHACMQLADIDGSRMHAIAVAAMRTYGSDASIIIDDDDAEVLIGRAGA